MLAWKYNQSGRDLGLVLVLYFSSLIVLELVGGSLVAGVILVLHLVTGYGE